jgi:hypothetical protein
MADAGIDPVAGMTLSEYIDAHPIDPNKPFVPKCHYFSCGDRLEYYAKNVDFYVEQVDALFWICRSFKTNEVVGFKFHNVRELIPQWTADIIDRQHRDIEEMRGWIRDIDKRTEHLEAEKPGG